MATIHPYGVEFIGGPFDGYKHVVSFPPSDLAKIVVLPVNKSTTVRASVSPNKTNSATSAAVYELNDPQGVCSYRYLGASLVEDRKPGRWVG